MIEITVKIHPGFQKLLSPGMTGKRIPISIPENSTVEFLLTSQLEFPTHVPNLLIVNGIHAKRDQVLNSLDRVAIFLPMSGG